MTKKKADTRRRRRTPIEPGRATAARNQKAFDLLVRIVARNHRVHMQIYGQIAAKNFAPEAWEQYRAAAALVGARP